MYDNLTLNLDALPVICSYMLYSNMFVVDIIFPSLLLVCSVDRSQEFHGGEMGNAELVEHLERQFAALGASGAHGRSAERFKVFLGFDNA